MECNFCSSKLVPVYKVESSLIGATVCTCTSCGLLQSVYADKDKKNKHTDKRISSDASWGNIRHGKSIRLEPSLNVLDKILKNKSIKPMFLSSIYEHEDYYHHILKKHFAKHLKKLGVPKS